VEITLEEGIVEGVEEVEEGVGVIVVQEVVVEAVDEEAEVVFVG
jgi:hypothetical protein